jgi:hypothetical protein
MSVRHDHHDLREASTASLAAVAVILVASALAFTAMTAPVTTLLGAGGGAVPAAFHGLAAFLYLFIGTIGLYLGWRLVTGRIRAFAELQLLATVSAAFSLIAIVFGNWLYIFYRAKSPESPRSYFIATAPSIHQIFFEFKEFGALFTLPLTVVAASGRRSTRGCTASASSGCRAPKGSDRIPARRRCRCSRGWEAGSASTTASVEGR